MTPYVFRVVALCAAVTIGLIGSMAEAAESGTFVGKSNHITKGMVTVTKNDDGTATVTLAADFWFDGAPDPRVGFGNNGKFTKGTNIGHLKANTGTQSYVVPANINVDDFNEVYIWCERFAVPLGVAALN